MKTSSRFWTLMGRKSCGIWWFMGWAEKEVIELTLRFGQLGDNCFATRNRGNQNLKRLGEETRSSAGWRCHVPLGWSYSTLWRWGGGTPSAFPEGADSSIPPTTPVPHSPTPRINGCEVNGWSVLSPRVSASEETLPLPEDVFNPVTLPVPSSHWPRNTTSPPLHPLHPHSQAPSLRIKTGCSGCCSPFPGGTQRMFTGKISCCPLA